LAESTAVQLGMVYLVGAGPGDPGLLTLRGAECLQLADVVIYDALANAQLLKLTPATAERVPIGKQHGDRCMSQETINELLITRARTGQTVVRLKGGDPFVFGRGGEEATALRAAGIPFEIVPGVTAGVAVPAYAGIPVTHRDFASSVAFVTGHEDPCKPGSTMDWSGLAAFPGTLVFYMGVRRLADLATELLKQGKPPHTLVAVIERGTTPAQRTVTGPLSEIAERVKTEGVAAPAVIVIGQVVAMADQLCWFEDRPLFGQCIAITRPVHQSESMRERLSFLGAEVLELPALRIEPPLEWSEVDLAIGSLSNYDWVVFTSANGVDYFLKRIGDLGHDVRVLGNNRIAAIGTTTANELKRYHLNADLVPGEANSDSLVDSFRKMSDLRRLLLLRADLGRDELPHGLLAAGIPFDDVVAYRSVEVTAWDPAVVQRIGRGDVHWITITSPRTIRCLATHLPDEARFQLGKTAKLASISPLTSAAAKSLGLQVAAEAESANADALIDKIVEWVNRHDSQAAGTCESVGQLHR